MEKYTVLNMIILILELIILAGQLYLSYRIHRQTINKEHSIFLPIVTNILHHPDVAQLFRFKYNLNDPLEFSICGENPVVVAGTEIIADGCTRYQSRCPSNSLYVNHKGFDILVIPLELRGSDLAKESIRIDIILKLEMQFEKYKECIHMEFQKERDDCWAVYKMNIL